MNQGYALPVLVSFLLLGCGGPERDAVIPWRGSVPLGVEAATDDQVLFVYFQAEWCSVCRQMEQQTFSKPAVARALSAYVPVKIDVDEQPRTAEAYLVTGTPTYVLVDKQGHVRARSLGFLNPSEMVQFLEESARLLDAERSADAAGKNP